MEKRSASVVLCLLQLAVLALAVTDKRIRRIDTHCHFVPKFYHDVLKANNISSGGRPIPDWNASAHLALMDSFNIDVAIVSASTPGAVLTKGFPIAEGRSLARNLNEYGYNLTKAYPKRFRYFASLTLPDVEGAVAEAIYALDNLKAAGVIVYASSHGELLGSPLFEPLYAVLNERNATVFVHPSNSPCPEGLGPEIISPNSTGLPPFVIDFLLDTTRAASNLVFRNVTQKYPQIRFILAHSGGFLPFAATRIAGALQLLEGKSPQLTLQLLNKFYVDVALSATATSLPSTLSFLPSSQITYGSDYPYAPVQGIALNSNTLDTYMELSKKDERLINFVNAAKLFHPFLGEEFLHSLME